MWALAGVVNILAVVIVADNDIFGDNLVHINEEDLQIYNIYGNIHASYGFNPE